MNETNNNIIRVQDLVRIYKMGEVKVHALQNLNLSILRGEFVSVTGASGSGKSTFLNIVGCLDKPTGGRYYLEKQDVSSFNRDEMAEIRNEKIGFVFQSFNLLARMTALENVQLPLVYKRVPHREQKERAMEALRKVGLKEREHHTPSQLSGGEQQRVAIARAFINSPSIILADEPTGNLDSRTSTDIMEIFRELNVTLGITVVLVTHESSIAVYASRNVRFKDGRVEEDIPIENHTGGILS
ncbi:MAG: ABC transporter ATP-binding protein [Pseudomonadota bacterium]